MHCHIDLFPSMLTTTEKSSELNMQILSMTTTPKAYEKEIQVLEKYDNIKIALGLHPQLVGDRFSELEIVERYIPQANYIGEVGLDFNRKYYASKEKQIIVFDKIIKDCAYYGGKVISIHSVNSAKYVIDILEKYSCYMNNDCILHWYSGDTTQLKRAVKMGCYFSINMKMFESENGIKNISLIPNNKILIESDAPFISNVNSVDLLHSVLSKTIEKLIYYKYVTSNEQVVENSIALLRKNSLILLR